MMYFGAAIQPILNPGAIVLEKEPKSNVLSGKKFLVRQVKRISSCQWKSGQGKG